MISNYYKKKKLHDVYSYMYDYILDRENIRFPKLYKYEYYLYTILSYTRIIFYNNYRIITHTCRSYFIVIKLV